MDLPIKTQEHLFVNLTGNLYLSFSQQFHLAIVRSVYIDNMNSSFFVTFEQNITIVVLSCDKQMLFGKVPAAEDHDYGLSLTFDVYLSRRFRPLHTCPSPYKAGQEGEESDLRKISEGTPTSSSSSST